VIGISLDDQVQPVREFYNQFKLNYPVALGDEQLAKSYGGIFSLPVAFLIGRDGRIYAKHLGTVDRSVFDAEIPQLLPKSLTNEVTDFQAGDAREDREAIEPGEAEELASEVPGVDLAKLTDTQKRVFRKRLEMLHCTCDCGLTVMKCRVEDHQCGFSLRMARQQLLGFTHLHP
jgi:hypothetical protein